MTNKLRSAQLKYFSIGYLRRYIKLLVLLFTLLIFKGSISEYEVQTYFKKAFFERV